MVETGQNQRRVRVSITIAIDVKSTMYIKLSFLVYFEVPGMFSCCNTGTWALPV